MTAGGVPERSIGAVLNTVGRKPRGFESHPRRQAQAPLAGWPVASPPGRSELTANDLSADAADSGPSRSIVTDRQGSTEGTPGARRSPHHAAVSPLAVVGVRRC